MGGGAANAAVSEFADRPPTPDPSPPRADARGGRGEEEIRHCERSEAIHRAAQRKNGLLRRFAPRNDDRHTFAFSRRDAPEFCYATSPPPNRGRRECRAPGAPAAARVMVEVKHTR